MIIEQAIIEYLNRNLGGKPPVYAERREKPEKSYILVEKTGGYVSNFVSHATVACKIVADTMANAAKLQARICDIMNGFIEETDVFGVYIDTTTNDTDVAEKDYQYLITFNISYVEESA